MFPRSVSAWLVRGWRLAALVLAAILLERTTPLTDSTLSSLTLEDAQAFFPDAQRLQRGQNQTLEIYDGTRRRLGRLVTTSPDTDSIIGYMGPSNLLVALDNQEKIVGTRILSSRDTPEHVDQLRQSETFLRSFKSWRPNAQPAPQLEAFAGSTLTAYAITESIQQRLSGNYVSLRFPTPLSLSEVLQAGFPDASSFEPNVPRLGWNLVRGQNRTLLGYVVRSSPSADEVIGFAGPSETLTAIEPDGLRLRKVSLRSTFDTAEYVRRIQDEEPDIHGHTFLNKLTQWSVPEWSQFDFRKAELDTVAGATMTSYALAKGLQTRFADDQQKGSKHEAAKAHRIREVALGCFILGGLLMTFSSLHGRPWVRRIWQWLLIGGLGLWLGQMVSLSLLAGWARHGLPISQSPGLLGLVAIAVLIPWATRRQIYCHQLCPHGAAQEVLGKFPKLRVSVPAQWHNRLARLPGMALVAIFFAALLWPRWNLGQCEPFDAWVLGIAVVIPMALAGIGLVAAICIPQAYCKYGCPTGALLKFVRSSSNQETWSRQDSIAAALLVCGAMIVYSQTAEFGSSDILPKDSQTHTTREFHGAALGTTWTIKIRSAQVDIGLLKREVEAEINRVEFSLSHWRQASATTEFNQFESTRPLGITQELVTLTAFGLKLSAATKGQFDLTIAPLSNLWGYGPDGQHPIPDEAQIKAALAKVGWSKLTLDPTQLTLAKSQEDVTLDLGSCLQGYAADCAASVLRREGIEEFLVEVGGEILASGTWHVGIEDPFNPKMTMETALLKDCALSVSGLYRARKSAQGKPVSHIISTTTGRPVEPTLEIAAVFHESCLQADGWSTALMAVGFKEAQRIAERENLKVILVTPDKTIWRHP